MKLNKRKLYADMSGSEKAVIAFSALYDAESTKADEIVLTIKKKTVICRDPEFRVKFEGLYVASLHWALEYQKQLNIHSSLVASVATKDNSDSHLALFHDATTDKLLDLFILLDDMHINHGLDKKIVLKTACVDNIVEGDTILNPIGFAFQNTVTHNDEIKDNDYYDGIKQILLKLINRPVFEA